MSESQVNWNNSLECVAVTDVGMRRSNNQDAHRIVLAGSLEDWKRRGHVFIVADGMGAHAAGELASELAAAGVPHHYQKYVDLSAPEALQKAIIETNAEVHRRGQANSDFYNMGTTASALILLPQGALLGHVGDSRVYRLRGSKLAQLTFDHSLVWELRAAGQISDGSELAATIPKNVITRSLGPSPAVQADIEGPFPVEKGDVFMLCSDGLTGQVEDEEIGAILTSLPPSESAQALVDLANLRGGPDNSTVLVIRVNDDELTTRVAAKEPLVIGAEKQPERLHPVSVFVMAVLLLGSLVMFMAGLTIPAITAMSCGGLVLFVGLIQRTLGFRQGVALVRGRRLGRGPYTQTDIEPSPELAASLAKLAEELRRTAGERQCSVDWDKFERHARAGDERQGNKAYELSVAEYMRAISFMMQEFRNQRYSSGSDSSW